MFIELTEYLKCPADHPDVHCVLAPDAMAGRDVIRGVIGCPACRAEYSVTGGIARFGPPPPPASPAAPLPDAATLQALLGLATPGGYAVLIGSAARAAPDLAGRLEGMHLVGINGPADVSPGPGLTLLEASGAVPLRGAMARGVVLGGELAVDPWVREAVRVLLPGLRVVVLADAGEIAGVETLAAEAGVWVGRKKGEGRSGKREA